MEKLSVLLSLCVVLASAQNGRIAGGQPTTIQKYPYAVVMLFSKSGSGTFTQGCGGTIINNRSVLSATHCFLNHSPINWRMRVGSTYANSGGLVVTTNKIILRPDFNRWTGDNDVAIIRSNVEFPLTDTIGRAAIASSNYQLPDNAPVWAIGWGQVGWNTKPSEQLREVQLFTINTNTCRWNYLELLNIVTDNMLCTGMLGVGGRDQCEGDSGGPVLHNNVVVGVCSWGYTRCGHPKFPGVNALVSKYTAWISSNA